MDQHSRSLRFGAAVIACALVFRLFSSGALASVAAWLSNPHIASFLIYTETGRIVRFSSSSEVFSPFSAESPPPAIPAAKPVTFTAEDLALIDIRYLCGYRPELETLLTAPLDWDLTDDEPSVLILSTHATESYTKNGENYTESSAYRTLDENYNMLSIGDRVAQILEQNGISVIRDPELHDYPSYNGSYNHARASIEHYLEEYPSIRLVLDLHRDASDGENGQLRTEATVDGQASAQLMPVMGTDAGGLEHDNWEKNLSLALKLMAQLERQAPGITRPLSLRSQRFNQDLSSGALLIEVGAAGNTHSEALIAAEQLAQAIVALSKGTE